MYVCVCVCLEGGGGRKYQLGTWDGQSESLGEKISSDPVIAFSRGFFVCLLMESSSLGLNEAKNAIRM